MKPIIPQKGSFEAASFELFSLKNYVIEAQSKELIDTGIKVELPAGCYRRTAHRSSLALNNFQQILLK